MTKQEFAVFAQALRTYYPREKILPNAEAMELWYRQLCDMPYKVAETALNSWVPNNKWSPSIAEILEEARKIVNGETPGWSEEWEKVVRAIHKYGYMGQMEALESFENPITRDCVSRLGFMQLCTSENQIADRANFRMIYEQAAARKEREDRMPTIALDGIIAIRGQKPEGLTKLSEYVLPGIKEDSKWLD